MNRVTSLLAAVAFSAVAATGATANAANYIVQATTDIPSWLDTGLSLDASKTYDFAVVNPATIWSAGSEYPYSRDSNANGINPAYYGTYTYGGFTDNFGALVGEAGSTFFNIGTGPTIVSGLTGELKVGYWDSYYGDNSGSQTLSITAVPEPATWAMMLVGLGGLGMVLRRRAGSPVAA